MDIAGFVGLASRGPVGIPVPVEDAGRFREIFGPDQALAWDVDAGRPATAFLGPAVDAFFRNGGRRCWVVRVARDASLGRFPLPALLDAATGCPARVHARSPGSWCDGLRVGTVLHLRAAGAAVALEPEEEGFAVALPPSDPTRTGDVLRARFGPGERGLELYLRVRSVADDGGLRRVVTGPGRAFLRRPPSPVRSVRVRVHAVGDDGEAAAAGVPAVLQHRHGVYRLRLAPRADGDPAPGGLLHVRVDEGPLAGRVVWMVAGGVERVRRPARRDRVRVRVADALWPLTPDQTRAAVEELGLGEPGAPRPTLEGVAVELVAWSRQQIQARLGNLSPGRSPAMEGTPGRHATRFWAELPSDDHLFRLVDGRPLGPETELARDAASPRFPLAGPADAADLYVPLGMPPAPDAEAARGPLEADAETVLERDGLAGFSPRWLVDGELETVGVGALQEAVLDKLYIRGAALGGLHAFWPIREVTLAAAPDAVQPGWSRRAPRGMPTLEAPRRLAATPGSEPGAYRIHWRATEGGGDGIEYELEESRDPLFAGGTVRHRGGRAHTWVYFGEEGRCGLDLGCLVPRYYRVRARTEGRLSPWSATLRVDPAGEGFRDCTPPLDAPRIRIVGESPTRVRWSRVEGAARYVLEAAPDVAFAAPSTPPLPDPTVRRLALEPSPERPTWYRVRAERDRVTDDGRLLTESGPWSGTVRYEPARPARWTMDAPETFDEGGGPEALAAFQEAALRLAAARGEWVTLLTLPVHYRAERAVGHVAGLAPGPGTDARSFAALYHPWLGVRDESGRTGRVRFLPPDGAVAGMAAARALARGAWVAPANVPLRDVVALEPRFDEAAWERVLAAGVNLVRPGHAGFHLMSAETLASGALRPLNVRRLLILLRRLALREGPAFAFESNSDALRRRLRLRFERFLTRMFERGAFAGSRPAEAFDVRTDAAVNPPESVDRGRLVVELRVAPSRPLAFLTVRLVQRDGAGLIVVEG
jgi:hypothetical protein